MTGQEYIKLPFSLRIQDSIQYFSPSVRISIFLPPMIVIISCQHLKWNKVYNIQSHIFQLKTTGRAEDDYKTDAIQLFISFQPYQLTNFCL